MCLPVNKTLFICMYSQLKVIILTVITFHVLSRKQLKMTKANCVIVLPAWCLRRPRASHKTAEEIQFSDKLITKIMQWWVYLFTHKYTNLLISSVFFFSIFICMNFNRRKSPPTLTLILLTLKHMIWFFLLYIFFHLSIKRTFHVHNKCYLQHQSEWRVNRTVVPEKLLFQTSNHLKWYRYNDENYKSTA